MKYEGSSDLECPSAGRAPRVKVSLKKGISGSDIERIGCLLAGTHLHTCIIVNFCRDGRRQIVFYQSGVGSEADFEGSTLPGASTLRTYILSTQLVDSLTSWAFL